MSDIEIDIFPGERVTGESRNAQEEVLQAKLSQALEATCHECVEFKQFVSVSGTLIFNIDGTSEVRCVVSDTVLAPLYYPGQQDLSPNIDQKPDLAKLHQAWRNILNVSTTEPADTTPAKRKRGRPTKLEENDDTSTKAKKKSTKKRPSASGANSTGKRKNGSSAKSKPDKKDPKLKLEYLDDSDDNGDDVDENDGDAIWKQESMEDTEIDEPFAEEDPLRCPKCDFVDEEPEAVRKHRKWEHGDFLCAHCPIVTDTHGKLKNHMDVGHPELPVDCDECNMKLVNRKALREHMKIIHCKWWRCLLCDQPHPNKEILEMHLQSEHPETKGAELFTCEKCELVFPDGTAKEEHDKHAHTYWCDLCELNFPNANRLTMHRAQEHPEDALKCGLCGRKVPTRAALVKHLMRHKERESGGYQCDICHKRFTAKSTLYHHRRGIHKSSSKYKCDECGKTFNFHHSLKLHSYKHSGRRPYPCKMCDKAYLTASHLKDHTRAVHSGKRQFKCPVCDKSFSYDNSLRMHMLLHKDERPFCCEVCGKMFVSKSALRTHEQLHKEEWHKCVVCDKSYKTKGLLRAHQRRHTADGSRYMCDICGNTFMYVSTLQAHKATHGEERAFTCNICGLKFKTNATLYSHRLVHSEDNPFRCLSCNKNFKTKERLKAHERRHLGHKPFACALCGSSFPDRGGLSKHIKTVHSTVPRFKCPVCGKQANRADNLRVHMKVHGDPNLLKLRQEQLMDRNAIEMLSLASDGKQYATDLPEPGTRGRKHLKKVHNIPPPKPGTFITEADLEKARENDERTREEEYQSQDVSIDDVTVLGGINSKNSLDSRMLSELNNRKLVIDTLAAQSDTDHHRSPQNHPTTDIATNSSGMFQSKAADLSVHSSQVADLSRHAQDAHPVSLIGPPLSEANHPQVHNLAHSNGGDLLNIQGYSAYTLGDATHAGLSQSAAAKSAIISSNVLNTLTSGFSGTTGDRRTASNPLFTLAEVTTNAQAQEAANQQVARVLQQEGGSAFNLATLQQYVQYSVTDPQAQQAMQFSYQPNS